MSVDNCRKCGKAVDTDKEELYRDELQQLPACNNCFDELVPFSDSTLIEIACLAAKAKPKSYYSEPFEPHEWVIDAMRMAVAESQLL